MVAGQVASQREQLKTSHNALAEDTEALAKRLAQVEAHGEAAAKIFADETGRLQEGAEATRDEISKLYRRMEEEAEISRTRAEETQQLRAGLDLNRGEITKLYERIESVDHVMLQGFGVLRDNLSALRKELQQVNQRVAALESGTASYPATEKTVEAIGRRLGELEAKEQANTARLQSVEQTAEQLSKREEVMARAARMLMSGQ
jgi:DNA anti-recombination protein RmuC